MIVYQKLTPPPDPPPPATDLQYILLKAKV